MIINRFGRFFDPRNDWNNRNEQNITHHKIKTDDKDEKNIYSVNRRILIVLLLECFLVFMLFRLLTILFFKTMKINAQVININ